MDSFSVFDFTITPFYYLGMCIWKVMLALIGVTAGETPQTFSAGTWNYITQSIYPLFLAIGSSLLNVFFCVGYLRSVSNLRDGMTLEMFIELFIKVALGNLVIQSIIPIMEQIFNLAGGISQMLVVGVDNPFTQNDLDGGAIFFMLYLELSFCSMPGVFGDDISYGLWKISAIIYACIVSTGSVIYHTRRSWCIPDCRSLV